MAKYYLIGIGGTGARCIEAFVHVLGAGILKETNAEVKVVFVDPDKTCGNLNRASELIDNYQDVQALDFGKTPVFMNRITKGPQYSWDMGLGNTKHLDDLFQADTLEDRNEHLGKLYKALYSEKERTTALDMGFRGHPAIGAAVLAACDYNNVEPWKTFEKDVINDKDVRAFIFGSVFGGTGAAGLPNIAHQIRVMVGKKVEIGATAVLPYFEIPNPPDKDKEELQVDSKGFNLSARSALEYYNAKKCLDDDIDEMYLIGNDVSTKFSTFSLGSNDQKNDSCITELYAALAAYEFFNKKSSKSCALGKPFTICRSKNGELDWNDIPEAGNFAREKMQAYLMFLYLYRRFVFKSIKDIRDKGKGFLGFVKYGGKSWIKKLVEKEGFVDKDRWIHYEKLSSLAYKSFEWLRQMSPAVDVYGMKIGLVDKFKLVENVEDVNLTEVSELRHFVNPVEQTSIDGEKRINQRLCNVKIDRSAVPAEKLMRAMYEIVSR